MLEEFDLLEKLQAGLVRGKAFDLDGLNVVGCLLKLNVKLLLVGQKALVLSLKRVVFLNK